MFCGPDVAVIAVAIIALGFFVWQAITGSTKKDETTEGPASKRSRRVRTVERQL